MILFLSAYPPRDCGLASYTHQLVKTLQGHFSSASLKVEVVALEEAGAEKRIYPDEVRYVLSTQDREACIALARSINKDSVVNAVCIQHKFGLWGGGRWGENLLAFVQALEKPLAVVMHNVLPEPEPALMGLVDALSQRADLLITQTKYHASLLKQYYAVPAEQVRVILPAAPTLLPQDKEALKTKYKLGGRLVLTCFGYMRRSKGLEYVLEALDEIRNEHPDVVLLMLGPTHQLAARFEGERYRFQLKDLIFRKRLHKHVCFVNRSLGQEELEEYLGLTDIYLHLSKNNANSLMLGMSSGCPVVATPSAITKELLPKEAGILVEPENIKQLAAVVQKLLSNTELWKSKGQQAQQAARMHAWPNIAMSYQEAFAELIPVMVEYRLPALNSQYLKTLTAENGLQHLPNDQQTVPSSYLLTDNAGALIAAQQLYNYLPGDELPALMRRYLEVLRQCQQADGSFITQLDAQKNLTPTVVLKQEEAAMQAFCALGQLIQHSRSLPTDIGQQAGELFAKTLPQLNHLQSLRAVAFALKGLYCYNQFHKEPEISAQIDQLAMLLQERFDKIATKDWPWFEKGLGAVNSILPEVMLLAWAATEKIQYKRTAFKAFGFLVNFLFMEDPLPATGRHSLQVGGEARFGYSNDPQDIAETIATLDVFYELTGEEVYLDKMRTAFNWFLGNNHLRQVVYNATTGSCCDGLESRGLKHLRSASSLVAYLKSRVIMEKHSLQQRPERQSPASQRSLRESTGVMPPISDRPSIPSGKTRIGVK